MSMININELFLDKQEKEKNKNEIYDNVLKQCHKRILRSVKLNPYDNYCFYIIPKFIYGIPLYDLNKCINYLVVHLTKNGFKINYTHPNLLIITWFKKEEPKQSVLFNGTKTNVKSINDYKPSGNLIYNSNFLKDIDKKKNYLLN
tara:strand:+ start:104 stop:538 length:435 start_codon:yes stop_codon:yes gene_type:complete